MSLLARAEAEAAVLAAAGGWPPPPPAVTSTIAAVVAALRPERSGRVDRDRFVLGLPAAGPSVLGALVAAAGLDPAVARARARDLEPGREVPGIDWSGAGLGHSLPAAAGFALAARLRGDGARTWLVAPAAELAAGPAAAARLLAALEKLEGLVAVALGPVPDAVAGGFAGEGWSVVDASGRDAEAFSALLAGAAETLGPVLVLAGGDELPAGAPAAPVEAPAPVPERPRDSAFLSTAGEPRFHGAGSSAGTFEATVAALADLAALTAPGAPTPFLLLDCGFPRPLGLPPEKVLRVGAGPAAVTVAGALSLGGVAAWVAGPAALVSGSGDAFQLCAVQGAGAKLLVDACGDRPATRAPNLFGVVNGVPGLRLYTPADPTQADRAVRFMATHRGSFVLALPASRGPVVLRENGEPLFEPDAPFAPTRADRVRHGSEITLACSGSLLPQALEAWEALRAKGRIVDLFSIAAWGDVGEGSLVEMARHGRLVCVEDHGTRTGLGTFLQGRFNDLGLLVRVRKVGAGAVPPLPGADYHRAAGLDAAAIVRAVNEECIRRGTLGPRIDPDVLRMM